MRMHSLSFIRSFLFLTSKKGGGLLTGWTDFVDICFNRKPHAPLPRGPVLSFKFYCDLTSTFRVNYILIYTAFDKITRIFYFFCR